MELPPPPPVREYRELEDRALKRFHDLHPPKYHGVTYCEAAEDWIQVLEKIFKVLDYNEDRKI